MKKYFGDLSPEDMILERSKFAIAKYFENANTYINMIANIFLERLVDGKAIWDLADVSWKTIDEPKLLQAVQILSKAPRITTEVLSEVNSQLTQDERLILAQYINMLGVYKSWNQEELRVSLNNLLGQSIWASSQLIVLELL
jgi:hypothetical protein